MRRRRSDSLLGDGSRVSGSGVQVSGFGVRGSGFRGSGFGVRGSGFGVRGSGLIAHLDPSCPHPLLPEVLLRHRIRLRTRDAPSVPSASPGHGPEESLPEVLLRHRIRLQTRDHLQSSRDSSADKRPSVPSARNRIRLHTRERRAVSSSAGPWTWGVRPPQDATTPPPWGFASPQDSSADKSETRRQFPAQAQPEEGSYLRPIDGCITQL